MPIYEYRCNDCGHQFEVVQSMNDEPIATCVECGGQVSRVLFAPAIHFKGKGFHNTDYGTKRRPVGGDGDSGGSAKSSGDGAGGGDAKTAPAAKESSSGGGKTIGLDKA
ncbi:MAG: FmdB family zinc ribbon protein [Thermoleophilia bacterium]